jgi:hypothetical protein
VNVGVCEPGQQVHSWCTCWLLLLATANRTACMNTPGMHAMCRVLGTCLLPGGLGVLWLLRGASTCLLARWCCAAVRPQVGTMRNAACPPTSACCHLPAVWGPCWRCGTQRGSWEASWHHHIRAIVGRQGPVPACAAFLRGACGVLCYAVGAALLCSNATGMSTHPWNHATHW